MGDSFVIIYNFRLMMDDCEWCVYIVLCAGTSRNLFVNQSDLCMDYEFPCCAFAALQKTAVPIDGKTPTLKKT